MDILGVFRKLYHLIDNISAVCSAFSGEEVKYTTVKRGVFFSVNFFFENNFVAGEVCIYDSRLSIFGNIQPGPLGELLNSSKKDDQGFFDR